MSLLIQSTPQRSTANFKWWGWSNGAKKKKKSLGLPATAKKIPGQKIIPCRIPSLIYCLCLRLGYEGTTRILQIALNTQKTPPQIKSPKKYLPNFPTQKKSRNRKFQTPKNPSIHLRHLKSGIFPVGSELSPCRHLAVTVTPLVRTAADGHSFSTDSSWIPDWNIPQL